MPRLLLVALLVCVWLCCASAQAQTPARVDGRAALLAGYDDNPSLATDPGGRLLPGMGASFRELSGSGILALFGDAGGEIGGSTWAGARLGFDLGWLTIGERRGVGMLTLSTGHRGRLAFGRLGLAVGRYGASFGVDDATFTRARLSTGLGTDLRATASLLGGLRYYDEGAQHDRGVGGELALGMLRSRVRWRVGLRLDDRFSTSPVADRIELEAWSDLRVVVSRVTLGASAAWQQRFFRQSDKDGFELTGEVSARVRLTQELGLLTRLEWGRARGSDDALDYDRVAILTGIELRLKAPEPPSLEDVEPDADAPVHADREQLVFRLHLPDATDVRVIGSFNGWDEQRGELRATGDGYFEGRFDTSPGRHHYRLLVDGEPQLPEGEVGVGDDFGGVDAVINVPRL